MPDLVTIRERLASHQPVRGNPEEAALVAAVALIFHEPRDGPVELLFIKRAHRDGDPWSGQMAFPGGRLESGDPNLAATATRETFEEIGVPLSEPIGRLDDLTGRRGLGPKLLVAPFVHVLDKRPQLQLNVEVNSAVWIPVQWILDPASASEYRLEFKDYRADYPAFHYDGYTVWGLTYRITESLMQVLGRRLPSHKRGQDGQQQSE